MKVKKLITAIASGLLVCSVAVSPAFAAPGDNGQGYGGCVDNFYGNATNPRPSGNGVLPSQSPGPFVNNPTDPVNPFEGPSVGDVMQVTTSLGFTGQESMELICLFP